MQAAQVAANVVRDECPIVVIDSRTVSMGLGALCLTAARRAADGATLEEIVEDVISRRDRTRLFGALDTLEYLKRGGRIGNARALLGSMLSIKPIVEVRDGVVEEAGQGPHPVEGARPPRRQGQGPARSTRCAVLHGQAPDLDDLLDLLDPIFPRDEIVTGLVGPVIGTHAGPGVIGVSFQVCPLTRADPRASAGAHAPTRCRRRRDPADARPRARRPLPAGRSRSPAAAWPRCGSAATSCSGAGSR